MYCFIWILIRDKGYRYKDIAVVCREIDSYDKITSVIFNEYNIPYFLDKKREILSNPLVVLIISSLEILSTNWSYESVFKYVKSGLITLESTYIDKLENYILANGVCYSCCKNGIFVYFCLSCVKVILRW